MYKILFFVIFLLVFLKYSFNSSPNIQKIIPEKKKFTWKLKQQSKIVKGNHATHQDTFLISSLNAHEILFAWVTQWHHLKRMKKVIFYLTVHLYGIQPTKNHASMKILRHYFFTRATCILCIHLSFFRFHFMSSQVISLYPCASPIKINKIFKLGWNTPEMKWNQSRIRLNSYFIFFLMKTFFFSDLT